MGSLLLGRDDDGAVVAVHRAGGDALPRVVSMRASTAEGDPPEEVGHASVWSQRDRPGAARRGAGFAGVGTSFDGGTSMVHGVNARSVLVAATWSDNRDAAHIGNLVRRVVECASDAECGARLAAAELREARLPGVRIDVVGVDSAHSATVDGADVLQAGETLRWPAAVTDGHDRTRDDGHTATIAARITAGGATILIALGPTRTAIPIRHWPGIDVVPQTSRLAAGAAQLAALASSDGNARRIDALVADLRAAALHEGEEAERLAAMMDRDGDDRGAEVRRGVAQYFAFQLAVDGADSLLEELGAGGAAAAADL